MEPRRINPENCASSQREHASSQGHIASPPASLQQLRHETHHLRHGTRHPETIRINSAALRDNSTKGATKSSTLHRRTERTIHPKERMHRCTERTNRRTLTLHRRWPGCIVARRRCITPGSPASFQTAAIRINLRWAVGRAGCVPPPLVRVETPQTINEIVSEATETAGRLSKGMPVQKATLLNPASLGSQKKDDTSCPFKSAGPRDTARPWRRRPAVSDLWVLEGGDAKARCWQLVVTREKGDPEAIKYSLSNAPVSTSLSRLAYMQRQRYWVERLFRKPRMRPAWMSTRPGAGKPGTTTWPWS
jgi:hypothetical protein